MANSTSDFSLNGRNCYLKNRKEGKGSEHISEILKRVFEELEKQYGKNLGARSSDLSGEALTFPGPASLSGRENQSGHFQR